MFSAGGADRCVGDHESTEARQTTISCIAVMVLGALALALPMPPLSSPAAQAPLVQELGANPEPAPVLAAKTSIEPDRQVSEESTQRALAPACAAQSWPYVCTEAPTGETAQRVRVIAADRTAPASLLVSASTRSAPVAASTADEPPKAATTVEEMSIGPLAAESSPAPIAATPADIATPVAAVADAAAGNSSKSKAAQAKRVRTVRSHGRSQRVVRAATRRRGTLAYNTTGGEIAGGALGYAAYPRHRMDSYPWAGLR
ncbi:MAG: hypothetical protein AB7O60_03845 [Variibacter sp.]